MATRRRLTPALVEFATMCVVFSAIVAVYDSGVAMLAATYFGVVTLTTLDLATRRP